jgi:hypothetical protein
MWFSQCLAAATLAAATLAAGSASALRLRHGDSSVLLLAASEAAAAGGPSRGPLGSETSASSAAPFTDCGALADCQACIAHPACGFCASTEQCVAGNEGGPAAAPCPALEEATDRSDGDAGWGWGQCPALAPCGAYETCGDCTARVRCGWCPSTPLAPDKVGCYPFQSTPDPTTTKLNWAPPRSGGGTAWCPSPHYMHMYTNDNPFTAPEARCADDQPTQKDAVRASRLDNRLARAAAVRTAIAKEVHDAKAALAHLETTTRRDAREIHNASTSANAARRQADAAKQQADAAREETVRLREAMLDTEDQFAAAKAKLSALFEAKQPPGAFQPKPDASCKKWCANAFQKKKKPLATICSWKPCGACDTCTAHFEAALEQQSGAIANATAARGLLRDAVAKIGADLNETEQAWRRLRCRSVVFGRIVEAQTNIVEALQAADTSNARVTRVLGLLNKVANGTSSRSAVSSKSIAQLQRLTEAQAVYEKDRRDVATQVAEYAVVKSKHEVADALDTFDLRIEEAKRFRRHGDKQEMLDAAKAGAARTLDEGYQNMTGLRAAIKEVAASGEEARVVEQARGALEELDARLAQLYDIRRAKASEKEAEARAKEIQEEEAGGGETGALAAESSAGDLEVAALRKQIMQVSVERREAMARLDAAKAALVARLALENEGVTRHRHKIQVLQATLDAATAAANRTRNRAVLDDELVEGRGRDKSMKADKTRTAALILEKHQEELALARKALRDQEAELFALQKNSFSGDVETVRRLQSANDDIERAEADVDTQVGDSLAVCDALIAGGGGADRDRKVDVVASDDDAQIADQLGDLDGKLQDLHSLTVEEHRVADESVNGGGVDEEEEEEASDGSNSGSVTDGTRDGPKSMFEVHVRELEDIKTRYCSTAISLKAIGEHLGDRMAVARKDMAGMVTPAVPEIELSLRKGLVNLRHELGNVEKAEAEMRGECADATSALRRAREEAAAVGAETGLETGPGATGETGAAGA